MAGLVELCGGPYLDASSLRVSTVVWEAGRWRGEGAWVSEVDS